MIGKDPRANTIVVGPRKATATRSCIAGDLNWLSDEPQRDTPLRCTAQYRAHGEPVPATVTLTDDRLHIEFDTPQSAVAPGQAIVLYDDNDRVLGGGWIGSTSGGPTV